MSGNVEKFRGFLVDSARCLEQPGYYLRVIDFAAQRGCNALLWHFTDDQGCSLRFDCLPQTASPHAFTPTEMRQLVRYALDRGITLIPELASLGHTRYITQLPAFAHLSETDSHHFSGICPVSPETRRVIRALLEETIRIFDCEHVHVGLDEVNLGGHPLTAAALQSRSRHQILAEYIQFVHEVVVDGCGRRMWMWGDALLADPQLCSSVPRDVVVCNWQYAPDPSPGTTQRLLDDGFDVVLCSALISHDQTLFPGERFALPNLRNLRSHEQLTAAPQPVSRAGQVLGILVTIWTPVRFLAESLWLGLDLAAAILQNGPAVDSLARAEQFGQTFYGIAATTSAGTGSTSPAMRFAAACERVFQLAPTRQEWIAVATAEPSLQPTGTQTDAQTAATPWAHVLQDLRLVRPSITDHHQSFDTFMLMVETATHAYKTAALLAKPTASIMLLDAAMAQRSNLLARLDQTWDRERFADDARKLVAPIPHFQDDHLLPLLRRGLESLRARRDRAAAARGAAVLVG